MTRKGLMTSAMVVMALAAASCGSDAPKTLSSDDFVSEMNSVCRTADRAIAKLDASDSGYISDIIDIVQTGFDDLSALKPPKALKTDFEDFTSNLDDQLTQFTKLQKAIKNDDFDAAQTASDKLDKLSKDGDDLADSIGAEKCVGVGSAQDPVTTDSAPDTTPETSPATDPPATDPPATDPPTVNTPLPINTTPPTTAPPTQETTAPTPSGSLPVTDASAVYQPLTGFSWDTTIDLTAVATPTDPGIRAYVVGRLVDDADPTLTFSVYVAFLTSPPWTQPQLDAYYAFEVPGGVAATTPSGLPGQTLDLSNVAAGAFTSDVGFGIAIYTEAGIDVGKVVDAFITAQNNGMMG